MDTEAQPLGMSINWSKAKVQDLGGDLTACHFCLWVHVCTGPKHLGIWYHTWN